MFTTWGKKLASVIGRPNIGVVIPYVDASNTAKAYIEVKDTDNTTLYVSPKCYSYPINSNAQVFVINGSSISKNSSYGVAFGSGNTSPTESDYTIEEYIPNLTVSTGTVVTVFDDVNYKYIARTDFTVANNTGSDVEISEICMFALYNTTATRGAEPSSTSSNRRAILIERTVLDNAITIPDGEAAVVRYEVEY